jgi:hypothetical protein
MDLGNIESTLYNFSDSIMIGPIYVFIVILCFYYLRELFYVATSNNWPTSLGMISESGIHTNYNHRVNERPVKEFKIRYSYSVSNQDYENDSIKFFAYRRIMKLLLYWNTSEKPLLPLLEKYKSGQQVTVYYNPRNPLNSVLEPGKFHRRPIITQTIAFLFVALFYLQSITSISFISLLVTFVLSYFYFQFVKIWIRAPSPSPQLTQPTYTFSSEKSGRFERNNIRSFPEHSYCENCGTLLQSENYPCPLCRTQ